MATKQQGTLLYGNMDMGKGDADAASMFIARMFDAATAIHKVHLMTTGPGSHAAHEALGDAYATLESDADKLAEAYMGCMKVGLQFDGVDAGNWPVEVRKIYDYIEANRGVMGAESHIQNEIDTILSNLSSSLFKLDRLA